MTFNVLSVGSRMWAAVAAAAMALGAAVVLAQTPGTDTHHEGAAEPAKANAGGMMGGQSAMADRKQMMAHMSAMHGAGGMMNKAAPAAAPDAADADHSAHQPEK